MIYVNMGEIVDQLSLQMRRALVAAVEEVMSETEFDERELFRAFRRAVSRKCSTWEQVPDNCVKD